MTSMLTNTTNALLWTLAVFAATTEALERHRGHAANGFDRTLSLPNRGINNETQLVTGAISHGIESSIWMLHTDTNLSFTGSDFLRPNPKSFIFIFVISTLTATASLVTVVGNIVVIAAIVIERRQSHTTNYFLVSLSLSDLWIGVGSIPFYTHYILNGYWALGSAICKFWLSLDWSICAGSQYTVFLITLDRYLSVTAPVKYRNWRTDSKVIGMIALSWIVPSCVYPPLILFYKPKGYVSHSDTECYVPFMTDPWFTFITIICDYWVSTILMCYFYWKIWNVAREVHKISDDRARERERNAQIHSRLVSNINNSWRQYVCRNNHSRCLHSRAYTPNGESTLKQTTKTDPDYPRYCGDTAKTRALLHTTASSPGNSKGTVCSNEERTGIPVTCDHVLHVRSGGVDVSDAELTKGDRVCLGDSAYFVTASDWGSERQNIDITYSSLNQVSNKINDADYSNMNSKHTSIASSVTTHIPRAYVSRNTKCKFYNNNYKHNGTNKTNSNDFDNKRDTNGNVSYNTDNNNINEYNKNNINEGDTSSSMATYSSAVDNLPYRYTSTDTPAIMKNPQGMYFVCSQPDETDGPVCRPTVEFSKKSVETRENVNVTSSLSLTSRDRKTLRTISFVLGAYLICWTPFHMLSLLPALCGHDCVHPYLYQISYWMCYLNSAINPFLYACANEKFRGTLMQVLKCSVC